MNYRRALKSIARRVWPTRPGPVILMYHRIAKPPVDPWGLAVSPAHFEEQLEVLRRDHQPLTLHDFAMRLASRSLPTNAVAVTFDDGYLDNLSAAKPRLAAKQIPATVFLVTGALGRAGEYWWDELARLILLGSPMSAEITVRGQALCVALGDSRDAVHKAIWQAFRPLDSQEREHAMSELRSIISCPAPADEGSRTMTRQEVEELIDDRLIAIGAHSVSHPVLPELEPSAKERELVQSRKDCADIAGAPITAFAYPYGEFDRLARNAVAAAGFSVACTTHHGGVAKSSDLLALPRIQVRNWDGDSLARALRTTTAAAP